jgi:hypothetical protein
MSVRVRVRFVGVALLSAVFVSAAGAYIHFPPMTLQKMCKQSQTIRLLKVTKVDKEKGVIVYEVAEKLNRVGTKVASFRHVLRADTPGAKDILDWAVEGKTAVQFAIETEKGDVPMAMGYVFIDENCYSDIYNHQGKFWLVMRAEPDMSACYHGSVDDLKKLVKDVLAGKEVKVPTKEPAKKGDDKKRFDEITDHLKKNLNTKE